MELRTLAVVTACLVAGCEAMPGPRTGAETIVVRTAAASPDQVTEKIKAYAADKKWAFLGANKVKNGEITMVKVCIPAVGAALWTVDMKLTALLPCGNLSLYTQNGRTQVAMLHPSYMSTLHPGAETEKAAAMATPLLMEMLESTTR